MTAGTLDKKKCKTDVKAWNRRNARRTHREKESAEALKDPLEKKSGARR